MIKLKPYKELLKMGQEKLDETLAPARSHRAKKQAELEIAKMDESMASQEAKIHELCAEKELSFEKIINAQNEYALMERKRNQFQAIIDQMFAE